MTFDHLGTIDYLEQPLIDVINFNESVHYNVENTLDPSVVRDLFDQWYSDVMFMSSPTDMMAQNSFAEIVKLGEQAIPAIIAEIGQKPSFLFLAAQAITGEDPITDDIRGNMRAMVGAWIGWHHKSKGGWL